MAAAVGYLVIDSTDPTALASFWCALLGSPSTPPSATGSSWCSRRRPTGSRSASNESLKGNRAKTGSTSTWSSRIWTSRPRRSKASGSLARAGDDSRARGFLLALHGGPGGQRIRHRRVAGDHLSTLARTREQPEKANICSARLPEVNHPVGGATILHADLDAFYASVEQLLDPSLRDRPIVVGGSVVLAASYEARSYGVRGGMPGWRARQLCGDLVFVGGHFRRYREFGDEVVSVFHDFTPRVERVSIDEAFLDVTGAVHLFGPPTEIAAAIRRRVREEIGLPLSVGVARTKHLAKVASQVAKPNGLVAVDPADERHFLDPLPVGLIWGVGPTTQRRLHEMGIHTIGQLAETDSPILSKLLGETTGAKLAALSANIDERAVEGPARSKSMGAQAALGRRQPTPGVDPRDARLPR